MSCPPIPADGAGRPVVFGEVLFDHFPDGAVVLGGAPFNVAWHLQAFGRAPLFVSRVGDDPLGRRIRGLMRGWHMDTAAMQLDSAHPTGTVEVSIEDGEPGYDIVDGRAYDFVDGRDLPPLREPSLLYHGSLALRGDVSRRTCEQLCRSAEAPVFLDVNLRPPWWQAQTLHERMAGAAWLKLNEAELYALMGEDGGIDGGVERLFRADGLRAVFLTRGVRGASLYTPDAEALHVVPETDLKVMDSVGAGDAFASVCILGLLCGWPLQTLLKRAQAFASAVVGVRGATIDDPAFYQCFVAEWRIL